MAKDKSKENEINTAVLGKNVRRREQSSSSVFLSSSPERNDLIDKSDFGMRSESEFVMRSGIADEESKDWVISSNVGIVKPVLTKAISSNILTLEKPNLLLSDCKSNSNLFLSDCKSETQAADLVPSLLKNIKENQEEKLDVISQRVEIGLARQALRLKGIDENEINLLLPIPELPTPQANKSNIKKKKRKPVAKQPKRASKRYSHNNLLSSALDSKKINLSSQATPHKSPASPINLPETTPQIIKITSNSNQDILDFIFAGKKQIAWTTFVGSIKKIFGPDNEINVKFEDTEEMSCRQYLLFYQSDLLKHRFMPPSNDSKKSSSFLKMEDLLSELGRNILNILHCRHGNSPSSAFTFCNQYPD